VGDKVGLEVESLPVGVKSKKLFPRYSGPFTIVKVAHGGKVLRLADVNGKERKVPNPIQKVKPWPDRQTLLEEFENFEIMKHKSKSKSVLKPTPKPTPIKDVDDMDVEDSTAKTPKKSLTPSNNNQEFDIMGNPIDDDEEIDILRANCAKKLELVENIMFTICTVDCFNTRPIFITAEMKPGGYLEENLFIINSDNYLRNNICTEIIL